MTKADERVAARRQGMMRKHAGRAGDRGGDVARRRQDDGRDPAKARQGLPDHEDEQAERDRQADRPGRAARQESPADGGRRGNVAHAAFPIRRRGESRCSIRPRRWLQSSLNSFVSPMWGSRERAKGTRRSSMIVAGLRVITSTRSDR